MKLHKIGETATGTVILVLEMNGNMNFKYPTIGAVVIDGGIHGNEWLGIYTVLEYINIISKNKTDIAKYYKGITFYFIPALNPDGYTYTFEVV